MHLWHKRFGPEGASSHKARCKKPLLSRLLQTAGIIALKQLPDRRSAPREASLRSQQGSVAQELGGYNPSRTRIKRLCFVVKVYWLAIACRSLQGCRFG